MIKSLSLILILITFTTLAQSSNEKKIGDKISNFSAIDDQGKTWELINNNSEFLIVYFYPAAMTGGCTKQACAYRNDFTSLKNLNTSIIAISGDNQKNLKYFKETYQLNFPLLSDSKGKISKLFGVPTKKGGSISREINGITQILNRKLTTARWTFILNKNREIIYINTEVNTTEDSKNAKEAIKNYLK
ncbi:peroxiredoxin [Lutibacter citreus]|uniref:peroxiredoxin n=1 Tax=Lutibacter citreus TaxID=2138210 RepID=UPI000DBE612A|nr:redoxin domain-containing protein [Lutibacter citreus]